MSTEVAYRRLADEEFERLLPIYEAMGEPLPIPERTVLYVAESGGEIVGLIAGQEVVCVSPLWVKEDFRGRELKIAERLAIEGYRHLPGGMQKVLITGNGHVELLAHWMGFIPKMGTMFMEAPRLERKV